MALSPAMAVYDPCAVISYTFRVLKLVMISDYALDARFYVIVDF